MLVDIQNVHRIFGARAVLDGISLRITNTSRIGVVGPNGAGKTTLLRLLSGEDEPDEGTISRARNLRMGMLPQEVATLGSGPVLDLVIGAQTELMEVQQELEQLQAKMAVDAESLSRTELDRLGDLQDRFSLLGGYEIESRALRVLAGLGFDEQMARSSAGELSGGWLMRVVMASLLLRAPDILLLDEPTNHLDLPSLEWFEGFLQSFRGAVVLISHDRTFLDGFCTEVVEISNGALERYVGSYTEYLATRALRRAQQGREASRQQQRVAEIERFISRFRAKATKARQVQSRVKMLDKLQRLDVTQEMRRLRGFRFPEPVRTGDKVVDIRGGVAGYGDHEVLRDLEVHIRRGDRLALVGPNGGGKTTLLDVISERLPLLQGECRLGANVSVGYFAQHLVQDLNMDETVLDSATAIAGSASPTSIRGALGAFLFSGDDVEKKVGILSGGEKARLALARLLLRPAPLLILDEPTNHLDVTSRQALEDALDRFPGTLVFVSHDRSFVSRLATAVVEVDGGRIERYDGDFDSYLSQRETRLRLARESRARENTTSAEAAIVERKNSKDRRRELALERQQLQARLGPLRKEKASIERRMDELKDRLEELDAMLAEPATYNDPAFPDWLKERSGKAGRLEWFEDRWVEIEEELEKAASGLESTD